VANLDELLARIAGHAYRHFLNEGHVEERLRARGEAEDHQRDPDRDQGCDAAAAECLPVDPGRAGTILWPHARTVPSNAGCAPRWPMDSPTVFVGHHSS
jgi:hypothetical protein